MKRYIKLYFTYLKRAIVTRLEYKKDALIGILSFFLGNVASILGIYFIVNSIPSLNGWTMEQLGFLYGFSMLPVAIDHLFSDDLWCVAYWKVRTGELDKYYLRPVPVLFQVIAETFQPEALGELLVGIIMLALCGKGSGVIFNFPNVLLLIVGAVFGAIIITSIKIITAAVAFYTKRSGPLTQVVYGFGSYTKYPLKIYPKFIQLILQFIVPFGLVISIPIDVVINEGYNPYLLMLVIIGVSMVFLFISVAFWNKAEKKYSSSGSS